MGPFKTDHKSPACMLWALTAVLACRAPLDLRGAEAGPAVNRKPDLPPVALVPEAAPVVPEVSKIAIPLNGVDVPLLLARIAKTEDGNDDPIEEADRFPWIELRFDEKAFEKLLYGEREISLEGIKKRLERMLQNEIDVIAKTAPLTDDQKQRLTLAGMGDIRRVLEESEAQRRDFEKVWRGPGDILDDAIHDATEIARKGVKSSLAIRKGPFEGDSLFGKVLKRTVDRSEFLKFEQRRLSVTSNEKKGRKPPRRR